MRNVLRVFALLSLAQFPSAEAGGEAACEGSYAQLVAENARAYWREEFSPLLTMGRPLQFDSEKLNAELISKLPKGAQTALALSARCADVGICLAVHGARLGFSPVFLLWDSVRVPSTMAFKTAKGLLKKETDSPRQILAMPMEIIYENAPYLAGYSALTAVGWNIPGIFREKGTTLIPEMETAVPGPEFSREDLLVFVNPVGALASARAASDYFTKLRTQDGKLSKERIVHLEISKPEELIQKLGTLREKGRIRELVIISHGSPGSFNFQSSGIGDLANPKKLLDTSGDFDGDALKRLGPAMAAWPKDLFAEDARIQLISCRVAAGRDGKKFVENMAGVMLQNGGTFIASPRSIFSDPQAIKHGQRSVEEKTKYFSGLSPIQQKALGLAAYHFVSVPAQFLQDGAHVGLIYNGYKALSPEDPVYVVPVGEKR
ncbi:MAG: DUF4347 domain-containing protein [Bdellovibrionales bacterium]|nr:DUF4347 domain-containing protein [Bdellovibrionales bacterium]